MKLIRLLKHDLSREARSWVGQDIVSREQAESILSLYGAKYDGTETRSLAYFALMGVSAIFFGVGLILLVSYNWEEIPRLLRMSSLVLLTGALNLVGFHYFRTDRIDPARIWFVLGSFAYGATIFLIGQIYHLGEHFPDGVLLWAIGVLPIALLSRSVLLMLITGTLSTIWLLMQVQFHVFPWMYALFLVGMLVFCFGCRRSLLVFLGAVVGLVTYLELLVSYYYDPTLRVPIREEHALFTIGAFLILHALSKVLSVSSRDDCCDYGTLLEGWTLRFGAVTLVLLSFSELWELLGTVAVKSPVATLLWAGVVLVVQFLLSIPLSLENEKSGISVTRVLKRNPQSLTYGAFFFLSLLLIIVFPRAHPTTDVLAITTNILILITGAWLMISGVRYSTQAKFYLGVVLLLVTALIRYFDLIGGYIATSGGFIISGLLLFIAAKYWKSKTQALEVQL